MNRRFKIIAASVLVGSGVLYFILSPSHHPHLPQYDGLAKQSLRSFLNVCTVYWAEHGGGKTCSLEVVTEQQNGATQDTYDYGFKPSTDVILSGSGNEIKFSATARHVKSKRSFHINASHEIRLLDMPR